MGAWAEIRDRGGDLLTSVERWYVSDPVERVPTGIAPLDDALGGGLVPRPYYVGGAPASGKSALALQISLNVAMRGGYALYYSGEMWRSECEQRLLACYGTMTGKPITIRGIENQGHMFRRRLKEAPLAGVDLAEFMGNAANGGDPVVTLAASMAKTCPGLAVVDGKPRVSDICENLAALAAEGIRPLVVLDYLSLIDAGGRGGTETERTSEAVEAARMLSYEFRVPVLVLAALGRAASKEDRAPAMDAFRDTSNVEYSAQGAIVLRRDGEAPGADGVPVAAHVVKLRDGTWPRCVRFMFDGARNHFRPLGR